MKKLYRSEKDKVFVGVIGGLGEYLNINSRILRILISLFFVFTAIIPGIIVYILASLVIKEKPIIEEVKLEVE